ncbi:LuxR C-terminal-related transcriptional regulator [Streptomyces erythrochromogenes]|uniref:LuxR C-terminal-related transcriptional regulator n=1 Tax=Streptomyces erythrochromogenes TaxID=285574 RepID=UPI000318A747
MSTVAAPIKPLSKAQKPVAQHLVEGLSTAETAERVWVTASTVTSHLRTIRSNLHRDSRCSRAVLAHALLQNGLVEPPVLPPLFKPFTPSPGALLLLKAIAEHSAPADIARAAKVAPSSLKARTRKLMHAMQASDAAHLVGLGYTLGFLHPHQSDGAVTERKRTP